MTADVKLLPCPFCGGTSTLTDKDSPICPLGHILCDDCYASADSTRWNQRATELLKAEIEALRAEVERLQREVGALHMREKRAEAYAAEKASETLQAVMARRDAEARAERLAEALRVIEGFTMSQFRDAADMAGACVETAHNALHISAAQEGGNGFWPEMTKGGGPDWTGFDG